MRLACGWQSRQAELVLIAGVSALLQETGPVASCHIETKRKGNKVDLGDGRENERCFSRGGQSRFHRIANLGGCEFLIQRASSG